MPSGTPRIDALGSLEVRGQGRVVGAGDLGGYKPRQVLALLLLAGGQPWRRSDASGGSPSATAVGEFLDRADFAGKRLLEVGCGTGLIIGPSARAWAERGPDQSSLRRSQSSG